MFDHAAFYAEAERVTRPDGVLAVWSYSEARINSEIDELMEWFMYDLLHDYWPPGRWYVRDSYNTLPFPFEQIQTPQFYCDMTWTLAHWLDYIKSWSSYNRYAEKHQADPLEFLLPKLTALWNGKEHKQIRWKLHLKCARLNQTQTHI